jgi:succinate-semialdehyde dehydrogenase/glutarate-semialdehyde dehydrogenase
VLVGGAPLRDAATAQYWAPTVMAGVTPEMDVFRHETFGPVAPFTAFADEDQAVLLAAVGGSGLSSAVFTADLDRAFRVAGALPAPHVVVNGASSYWEMHLPWGGGPGTDSGIGRLGGDHALVELSTTSSVVLRTGS